jgi:hypothetical protein
LNSNYLYLQPSQDCDNYCGAQFEQQNVTSNQDIQLKCCKNVCNKTYTYVLCVWMSKHYIFH